MTIGQIHSIVYVQIIWSFLVAMGIAILTIGYLRNSLGCELCSKIIEKNYDVSIQVGGLELLPSLLWTEYYIVSGVILLGMLAIAMGYLRFYIRSRRAAAHLFSGV